MDRLVTPLAVLGILAGLVLVWRGSAPGAPALLADRLRTPGVLNPDVTQATIAETKSRYGKDVIVVETGYPFTLEGADTANNLLGTDGLVPGYPATPEGQRKFMVDLTQLTIDAGGIGVVYWEPYWVSTKCGTRWGKGSDWENAAWFDYKNHDALPVFEWLRHKYRLPR